jgi:hypothetical protein
MWGALTEVFSVCCEVLPKGRIVSGWVSALSCLCGIKLLLLLLEQVRLLLLLLLLLKKVLLLLLLLKVIVTRVP